MELSQVVEFVIESLPQLVGTFVGGILSLIGVAATNRHARKLAKISRDEERSRSQEEFQLDNLLQLQEAVQDLGRSTGQVFFELIQQQKSGVVDGYGIVDNELSERLREHRARVKLLSARCAFEPVRAALSDLLNKSHDIALSSYGSNLGLLGERFYGSFDKAMDAIGVKISLYVGDGE